MALVAVLLPHDICIEDWQRRFAKGEILEETPYGYGHVEQKADVKLLWSASRANGRLGSKIRSRLRRMLGFDLINALLNLKVFRRADLIWTHTEQEFLGLCILRWLHLFKTPMVGQVVWLADLWPDLSKFKQVAYRHLLDQLDIAVTLSPVNAATLARIAPGLKIRFIPFGVTPLSDLCVAATKDLVAVGNDRHRDWTTLYDAVSGTGVGLTVFSRVAPNPFLVNVHIGSTDSGRGIISAYTDSSVVVVPLTENEHASGITVVLEAVWLGRPVIATRTGGLNAYFSETELRFVDVGDSESLRLSLTDLLADTVEQKRLAGAARERAVRDDYSTAGYSMRLWQASQHLIA